MKRMLIVALATLLSAPVFADDLDSEEKSPAQVKMDQFKKAHPDARFHGKQYFDGEGFFEQDNTADFIYGTVMATGGSAIESAWNFYEQIEGIYAEEIGELVPGTVHGAMWDKDTETHRFSTFRFQQTVAGIPVYRSGIGFLVRNEDGFPVVMTSNNLKEMSEFDAAAGAFVVPKATEKMIANAAEMMNEAAPFLGGTSLRSVLDPVEAPKNDLPVVPAEQELVIWAGMTNVKVEPQLAIKFMAERGNYLDASTYQKHLIIAAVADGSILYSQNQIVADVDGTVSGQATDSDRALECDPEIPFAMPYAQVEIVGGSTTFADADGNFNVPSGNGQVTVRSRLRGQYFEVFDDTMGGQTPFIDINVASPGSVDFLHNPNSGEFPTSNVNCYLHANIVRDFVLSFEPTFPTIANQTFFDITSNNDNISGITSCNATYNGSAINFMRNLGNCNNTSIPDVVYHEYGHHLVNVTGNSQGQFGEGSGDTIGVLIEDDPDLALGFFEGNCSSGIRSANNFRTFPCDGAIHDCGQLISGCVWDTINEIRAVDPANARDITAGLFIGMLIVRGQMGGSSTIGPEVTLIFLELDDDDGNIGNGTPHYQQIAAAFNAHNMMAPELDPVIIDFPNGLPESLDPAGGTTFEVDVTDVTVNAIPGSGRLHYNDGGGFQSVAMGVVDADTYLAIFPATTCGSSVEFYVSVDVQGGGEVTSPAGAPSNTFSAISASAFDVAFLDTFDTNQGWSVSGDATDGQWQRAIPNNGDRGDPAVDAEEDGSGFCFVTDNGNTGGNDNTDVDGGSTILTSPVMDASAGAEEFAYLTYYRWYSNDFGNAPFADTFVVEISNNGGATWTNLETVGPTGPEVSGGWFFKQFRIDEVIAPTNNMRVRFTASDLADGSVVEAAVDRVEIQVVSCEPDVLLGDVNMDGTINLLDVAPFVDILANSGFQAEADLNQDGVVNLLDVDPFIALLSGG